MKNEYQMCLCGCGKKITIQKYHKYYGIPKYIIGHNKSQLAHGESGKTKLYRTWLHIKDRCLNYKNKDYKDYGGRGITICPEWTESYIVFRDWSLNNGYADNLEIDRWPNNDGNYEPKNCRWVTHKENCNNRRGKKLYLEKVNEIRKLYATGNYTQKELAEKFNVSQTLISQIILNKIWIKK